MDSKSPYLCGGVFFFLLLQAVLPNGSARDHKNGIKDEHKAPVVMSDLVYVVTNSKNYYSEKDTSLYRECKSEGTVNLPFNDIAVITAFDNLIKEKYPVALKRMTEFAEWHINPEMETWLVRAILELIEKDREITASPQSYSFYIKPDGSCVTVSEIKDETVFDFQPFLLGILHFILTQRRGKNHTGTDTLDSLGTQKTRKPRVYTGNIGENISRQTIVAHLTSVKIDSDEKDSTKNPELPEEADMQQDQRSDDEVIIDAISKPLLMLAKAAEIQKHQLAEQIRHNNSSSDDDAKENDKNKSGAEDTGNAKYVQQTIVNQYGDHPVNIGHVENLKL